MPYPFKPSANNTLIILQRRKEAQDEGPHVITQTKEKNQYSRSSTNVLIREINWMSKHKTKPWCIAASVDYVQ